MTDDDLKLRSIKIGSDRWARWQTEARDRGLSLTALIVERMDAVAVLTTERDAARSTITSLEGRVGELESYTHGMAETLDAKNARIAELEKEVGRLLRPVNNAITALAQLRANPAMKAIDPKVHHVSGPVLTDPVPRDVAGKVEWCGLKGQDKAKGKGKS